MQRLLGPFVLSWIVYAWVCVLLQTPAFRLVSAGSLRDAEWARNLAASLTPTATQNPWYPGPESVAHLGLFVLAMGVAFACWGWGLRLARTVKDVRLVHVLAGVTLLSLPWLLATSLFSDDVYLYHFYGRELAKYATNPILVPPGAFDGDPHLAPVFWKWVPAPYGPVFLLLAGALSRLAGESLLAAVLLYRAAALIVHLLTTVVIWKVLQRIRPEDTLRGTLFYAANPLILVEVVSNAHNDAGIGLFAALIMLATVSATWLSAVFFAVCAAMVKPYAAILLVPLIVLAVASVGAGRRRRFLLQAFVVGSASLVVLNLPLWSDLQLLENIRNNPASRHYNNSLWAMAAYTFGGFEEQIRLQNQPQPVLDALRYTLFFMCLVLAASAAKRFNFATTSAWLWVGFCFSLSWVWPWYVVPAVALAALAGGRVMVVAAALSLGGVLYWVSWPPPGPDYLAWIYPFRSVFFFGPALVVLAFPVLSRAIGFALGGSPGTAPARARDRGGLRQMGRAPLPGDAG